MISFSELQGSYPGNGMQGKEVWVVDDSRAILSLVNDVLEEDGYEVRTFDNPLAAMESFYEHQPHVIVSDIMMPGLDGVSLLEKICEADQGLPVILMTSNPKTDTAMRAVRYRAFEYLLKPVTEEGLKQTVKRALRYRELQDEQRKSLSMVEEAYHHKIAGVEAALKNMKDMTFEVLRALARATGFRDNDTGDHIMRIGLTSKTLAMELGLPQDFCDNIFYASPMHDIGKIGIRDSVLLKKGPLDKAEFDEMKQHTMIGAQILSEGKSELMSMAREIALCHHEKWDGSGYPHGKSGMDIPLSARIVMLVDTYDALRSDRPYRKGFTHDEAVKIISDGDGRVMPQHFDPDLLEMFLSLQGEFGRIFALIVSS